MAGARRESRNFETSRDALSIVSSSTTKLHQSEELNRSAPLAEKAYRALHLGFVVLPLVAGLDKFSNVLTSWSQYLAFEIPAALSVNAGTFMLGVGAFELLVAIGIALKPRLFADIFSAYCLAIIANLLLSGDHFDVALFTTALAAGACGLARLSSAKEHGDFDDAHDDLGRPPYRRNAA